MEGDQPVQSHSHTQQPLQQQTCVQEHCPGETGLPSSVVQGSMPFTQSISSTTLQSPELLIQCGFLGKKTMQFVSGKVDFKVYLSPKKKIDMKGTHFRSPLHQNSKKKVHRVMK